MIKLTQSNSEFGITIPCYWGDRDLLTGCLSSIRDFYPDTPICLIPHGRVVISPLIKRYGVTYIDPSDADPRLRAKSYGYGLTKMLAFWHAPFERFLHIDADTVCWGRFFDPNWLDSADFVANTSHETVDDTILGQQYFTVDDLPNRWKVGCKDRSTLFNSGTFGASKGLFSIEEYLELVDLMNVLPSSIFLDQGILNLMVQAKLESQSFRFAQKDLQAVVAVLSESDLDQRFLASRAGPIVKETDSTLIHWAGPKPRRGPATTSGFVGPMDYYRLKHLNLERLHDSGFGRRMVDLSGAIMMARARLSNRIESEQPGSPLKLLSPLID